MSEDKLILGNVAFDQGDILRDSLQWHLDLGVDFIIVMDLGSTDDTHDVLDYFAKTKQLMWFTLPERNMLKYSGSNTLATMARDRFGADWIMHCDVDEFLCPQGNDLRTVLRRAKHDDVTVINVPCFNMTGPVPETRQQRATQALTLRIDRPVQETHEQQLSGEIPVPYVFIRHPPKTIVRASAFVDYVPGGHGATGSWGRNVELPNLRFLHYPMRGFDKFQQKIRNTAAWLADNPHLEQWWGWHWRRWIRLNQEGRLREDYDRQFVSAEQAEELVRDGTCTRDETIADWINRTHPVRATLRR